eukprot:GHVT01093573.1.p1 GENE.GHVT01093573.1~~GHVT01093573.1.p1  ORF type:complete len:1180 (+),score=100.71 GHVT01093573.1:402-3941(+)
MRTLFMYFRGYSSEYGPSMIGGLALLVLALFVGLTAANPPFRDPRPVQLIEPTQGHSGLRVNEEGLRLLEKIPGPISVLTAVGVIHSGKSFLLNQLLGRTNGFPLGYTVRPGTYGVQLWSSPLAYTPDGPVDVSKPFDLSDPRTDPSKRVNVLVLDTEGFAGPNVTRAYDHTLYAVAALASSEILYTTKDMIHGRDLELLQRLTKKANLFALLAHARRANETTVVPPGPIRQEGLEKAGGSFPLNATDIPTAIVSPKVTPSFAAVVESLVPRSLTWVVQAFNQDLEGQTPKQWLDDLIKARKYDSDDDHITLFATDALRKNGPTEGEPRAQFVGHSLTAMYEQVDCVALTQPTTPERMQRLDSLSNSDLDPVYRRHFEEFRERLLKRAALNPKRLAINRHRGKHGDSESPDIVSSSQSKNTETVFFSGKDLADLLRFLVEATNMDLLKQPPHFFDEARRIETEIFRNELFSIYRSDMSRLVESSPPPSAEEVNEFHDEEAQRLTERLRQQSDGDNLSQTTVTNLMDKFEKGLSQMHSTFLARCELRIAEHCRRFCREAQIEAEHQIAEYRRRLPDPPEELASWVHDTSSALQRRLLMAVTRGDRRYSDVPSCRSEIESHTAATERAFRKFEAENEHAIHERFLGAIRHSAMVFSKRLMESDSQVEFRRHQEEFERWLGQWKAESWKLYEDRIDELRVVQPISTRYAEEMAKTVAELESEAQRMWDTYCVEDNQKHVDVAKENMRARALDELGQEFPVDEATLKGALDGLASSYQDLLRRSHCVDSTPWREVEASLSEVMETIRQNLIDENVTAIKQNFEEPLRLLMQRLEGKVGNYFSWWAFREFALKEAQHRLNNTEAQRHTSVQLTDSLINSVTVAWAETDLKEAFEPQVTYKSRFLLSLLLNVANLCICGAFYSAGWGIWHVLIVPAIMEWYEYPSIITWTPYVVVWIFESLARTIGTGWTLLVFVILAGVIYLFLSYLWGKSSGAGATMAASGGLYSSPGGIDSSRYCTTLDGTILSQDSCAGGTQYISQAPQYGHGAPDIGMSYGAPTPATTMFCSPARADATTYATGALHDGAALRTSGDAPPQPSSFFPSGWFSGFGRLKPADATASRVGGSPRVPNPFCPNGVFPSAVPQSRTPASFSHAEQQAMPSAARNFPTVSQGIGEVRERRTHYNP